MRGIVETYRLTKKTPDIVWNEYVCRPVAAVVVHGLAPSRVTPNQVTLAALVVAALSAVLLVALPGHVGLIVAIVVFELSYVLDCADGMLARLRHQQSTAGHLFDFLMDEIKAFLILGSAAIRLWFERDRDPMYLLLGIGGLVALASGVALTTFVRRPEIAGPAKANETGAATAGASPLGKVVRTIERLAKLLIHYPSYIWVVALAGHLEWYLYPYVLVNALYAARALFGVALRFGRA
jgi:phosphatidylglycerophosphate synthase